MLNKNTENVKNTNGTQMEKIYNFIKKNIFTHQTNKHQKLTLFNRGGVGRERES